VHLSPGRSRHHQRTHVIALSTLHLRQMHSHHVLHCFIPPARSDINVAIPSPSHGHHGIFGRH